MSNIGCCFTTLFLLLLVKRLPTSRIVIGSFICCYQAPAFGEEFDKISEQHNDHLRDELSRIDESWATARFDSLPHVVRILTSKDREGELQFLKEQSDVVEDVVDEVVHAYHGGFNKAIQNYSQVMLGPHSDREYRTLFSVVPARIEKLISDNQLYAAAQSLVQSVLMLEREGLQTVGALQDVRSDLSKLRSVLFYKVLEDLHAHLYNKGEYSSITSSLHEKDDEVPTTTAVACTANTSHPGSRRTRSVRGDGMFGSQGIVDGSYRPASIDGGSSYDGHDEDGYLEPHDNVGDAKDAKVISHQIPLWLSSSTPDEFVETIKKSDAPLHVKYLQTMVECLCLLNKVGAAGAVIRLVALLSQRLRPTIHDIITSKIKAHAEFANSSRSGNDKATRIGNSTLHSINGQLGSYQLPKQKRQNGMSLAGTLLAVSPVSLVMAPTGKAQAAAKELLDSILESVVRIFENHVVVGELIQSKSSLQSDPNAQKSMSTNVNLDSEASQVTGGYSIGFPLTVLQSECQQLICEILRATPEAASADASQTARLASKVPTNERRQVTGISYDNTPRKISIQ
ncbi:hypothetical protein Gotri_001981 [Gossypium trilobum]|uniref:Exocyst complex component Sec8 n=1 Tax=Gossypium trilobum TaxID=34281 RepID=A0A7J9F6U2_9ROSI|nr:hypothetical protein [Gossypium trilobum]